ncbi:MAG TPA: hypothetical protein VI911_11545 [Patescibacteria group bacterium]|nr:hypothetical protein [Patescibacteria group bacterium]
MTLTEKITLSFNLVILLLLDIGLIIGGISIYHEPDLDTICVLVVSIAFGIYVAVESAILASKYFKEKKIRDNYSSACDECGDDYDNDCDWYEYDDEYHGLCECGECDECCEYDDECDCKKEQ